MALDPSNSSNLEQLALKGLILSHQYVGYVLEVERVLVKFDNTFLLYLYLHNILRATENNSYTKIYAYTASNTAANK